MAIVTGSSPAIGADAPAVSQPPPFVLPTPPSTGPVISPQPELEPSTPIPKRPVTLPVAPTDWLASPVPPGVRPMFLQSTFYDVAGPDFASTDTVYKLTQAAQKLFSQYFTWPSSAIQPIQVQLVPTLRPEVTGPFTILADSRGGRTLLIRWNADTRFSDVCLALSSVTLEAITVWRRSPAASALVPEWLKIGFGKMLEAQIKPALIEILTLQAQKFPGLSLRQIMTAHGPFDDAQPVLAVNAYWLIRYLDEQLRAGADTRGVFDALAEGGNPVPPLQDALPGRFTDPKSLELWWRVGYGDVVDRRQPVVETLAQTHAALDRLQEVVIKRGDAQMRVRLDDAWAERNQPEVHSSLQATLIITDKWRPFANPVYNNAIFSLMEVLNTMLGKNEAAFRSAWKKYDADRAQAEAIETEVNAALK